MTSEDLRIEEDASGRTRWKRWGPYLSERQWGTVREDYSRNGDAWAHFPFEDSHRRAYRWGEDGLAGFSDSRQHLCFSLALWNGQDDRLKERLFGLTNPEGNHGEDVKEYYFYLDNTPSHSYQKYLYKYPQAAFPYRELKGVNASRSRRDFEYELIDTGVFEGNRYFDVFIEYAKSTPDDILIQITAWNRGDRPAELHLLPTLWFRNSWSWGDSSPKPSLDFKKKAVRARHRRLPEMWLACEEFKGVLFTENDTEGTYSKAAFHRFLIDGDQGAVNPKGTGTKAAFYQSQTIAPGESRVMRLRLSAGGPSCFDDFEALLQKRRHEADEFYQSRCGTELNEDQCRVVRQALAGMLWNKQCYHYDVHTWTQEHLALHGPGWVQQGLRNRDWQHLSHSRIISMPDKWEYPWYAAWDLAFHTLALGMVDRRFAKQQLLLLLQEPFLHPNGQIPAYEWNFGDVNPPVHAYAVAGIYFNEKYQSGRGDLNFLKSAFHKLMLNFTWWVNRKDRHGHNVFEGGFLGLDNIGVFDRGGPLPAGGHLEQADGTAWMCLYCQNMFSMALELAYHDPSYSDLARKFTEHFFLVASAMASRADGMWDEEDGFFYDVLRLDGGFGARLKVRSLVGLLPLCAVSFTEGKLFGHFGGLIELCQKRLAQFPDLVDSIHDPLEPGHNGRHLLAVLTRERLLRVLKRLLDPEEFLSDYGIRSLSRYHHDHPYTLTVGEQQFQVGYTPAESDSNMFGGNSNWRGPIWFPINSMIIQALLTYYGYYGNDLMVECPTGSGHMMNLYEVAQELARRLGNLFLTNEEGQRPVFGGTDKFQNDPHWKDHLLFYEYFHGDNGAGLGASHQTGWTGLVAPLLQWFPHNSAEQFLESGWVDMAADPRPMTQAIRRPTR